MSDAGDPEPNRRRSFGSKFSKLSSKMEKIPNPFKRSHESDDHNADKNEKADLAETSSPDVAPAPASAAASASASSSPSTPPGDRVSAGGIISSAKSLQSKVTSLPAKVMSSVTAESETPQASAEVAEEAVSMVESSARGLPNTEIETSRDLSPEEASAVVPDSTTSQGENEGAETGADGERPPEEGTDASEPPPVVVGGPVSGTAELAVVGARGDRDEVLQKLRKRGFIVHLAMIDKPSETLTIAMGLGPKLLVKIALEMDIPRRHLEEYSSREMSLLCSTAVKVLERSGLEYSEVVLLHNKEHLSKVAGTAYKQATDAVFSYYGSYIALYFGWLRFYTKALAFPAAAGVLLTSMRWYADTNDTVLMPAYCVGMAVWSTLFLRLWARTNSKIVYRWGVFGADDHEVARVIAEKAGLPKPNPAGKYCVTVPIVILCIAFVVRAMLYCVWLYDNAVEVFGEDSLWKYWPLVLYSIVPVTCSAVYGKVAVMLNNYEEHPTEARRKDMLIIKMFAFQFVNSYCALLYIAFWLQDMQRLRSMLMSLMVTKQIIFQITEYYVPQAARWYKARRERQNPSPNPVPVVAHTGTVTMEDLQSELRLDNVDIGDDYLEMVIQFGYVSMFSVAFPLAPLLALVNNKFEFMLDLKMLVEGRRPHVHVQSSIGSWRLCLQAIAYVSCFTNILIAVLMSENIELYVPSGWHHHLETIEGKVLIAVLVEHLLLFLKLLIGGLIDDVPLSIQEGQAIAQMKRINEATEYRMQAHNMHIPKHKETSVLKEDEATQLRRLHQDYEAWSFSPAWGMPLAVLPLLVTWWGLPMMIVIPAALVLVSYMQNIKDKADHGVAMGVVQDPKVLKLITHYLPGWYTDSEVERVEWINKILQKMWVPASGAVKDIVMTSVQPLLNDYRPPGINALGFRTISLGNKAPKIVGARTLDMKTGMAVLEVELRWASDAEIVVEAGVKPIPILITLSKIRFSGKARVELAPLIPVIPCFGALMVTFMEKPFVDFSFKLGKLDVMSIGPGEASIGNAVSNLIKNIVSNMMLYPAKMVIPMLDDVDVQALANPSPSGLLQVELVGAVDLKKADMTGKADPYVIFSIGQEHQQKSSVKSRTLDPRWNEPFDFMVYDPSVQILTMEVFDEDKGPTGDDSLGLCELPLSVLKPGIESAHNIPLTGTNQGSLLLKATYIALTSGTPTKEEENEDLIIETIGDDDVLTDETVATFKTTPPAPKPAAAPTERSAKGAVDPESLPPTAVIDPTDTTMGVLTVMGIQCRDVKPGKRYLSVICGNNKRKTAEGEKQATFSCDEVFHFLVRGAKSASIEVLLKSDKMIGKDTVKGSVKVRVAEVMANDDDLEDVWVLSGDKAEGSIKMRLRWSGVKDS